jgi:large subunit ribosomal protein L29
MKMEKLRDLDTAELANQARESEEQMFRLRFHLKMGQTDGVKRLRELRKDRARILTLFKERGLSRQEIAGATAASPRPAKAKKGKK